MPGRGNDGTGLFPPRPAKSGTGHIWAGTATGRFVAAVPSAFSLETKFQTGVAPVALGVLCHDGNGFFAANDDQQFSGAGDGGVEDTAAEQIRRTVPGGKNHGPVL